MPQLDPQPITERLSPWQTLPSPISPLSQSRITPAASPRPPCVSLTEASISRPPWPLWLGSSTRSTAMSMSWGRSSMVERLSPDPVARRCRRHVASAPSRCSARSRRQIAARLAGGRSALEAPARAAGRQRPPGPGPDPMASLFLVSGVSKAPHSIVLCWGDIPILRGPRCPHKKTPLPSLTEAALFCDPEPMSCTDNETREAGRPGQARLSARSPAVWQAHALL